MIKCTFDKGDRGCSALISKQCSGCAFYKTEQELRDGRRKSAERLESLPNGKELKEKYYSEEGWKRISGGDGI